MVTATITQEGWIALPKEILTALHLGAGDQIQFELDSMSSARCIITNKRDIMSLQGIVANPGKSISLEAMDTAIKARAANQL